MKLRLFFSFLFPLVCVLPVCSQPSSPVDKIEDLIGKMTLDEKIDFIGGVPGISYPGSAATGHS